MKTFKKYEKTYRIATADIPIRGKFMLTEKEEKRLLNGTVVVTEKCDGANVGIFKKKGHVFGQKKRGNIDHSHYQYTFFEQWIYINKDKLEKLPDNTVTYMELMRCVHSIYYDRLPDWVLVFDVYDLNKERFLDWNEVVEICKYAGLHTVPFIYEGKVNKKILMDLMPGKSAYGDIAEGIVVKNYRQQIRGKIVKPGFIKTMEEEGHWRDKSIKLNEVV